MEPTPEQRAWAAGFFDGEGSWVTVRYRTQRWGVCLYVSQVDPWPLHRFMECLDLVPHGRQYREETHREHPIWRLRVHKQDHVWRAAMLMWDWMSPRRRQQFADMWMAHESSRR